MSMPKSLTFKKTLLYTRPTDAPLPCILHCDLNNFYASVACRDNPEIAGKPVAVCGDPEQRHGIVLAKNYLAKSHGVTTGEAIWEAKEKCPGLVIVKPDFPRYNYFSKKAMDIYKDYSDLIEPFGLDEAWIDVTGSQLLFGDGRQIADTLRQRLREELGLTISVGVSFNKVFAKLGSDLKKPDATSVIPFDNFKKIVWPLPVEEMIGVGPATKRKLQEVGIFTLGELARFRDELLEYRLGVRGLMLKSYANGGDCSPVQRVDFHRIPQSVGRSETYYRDLTEHNEVWRLMLKLADEVATELRLEGLAATAVQIHLRSSSLHVKELQIPLEFPTQLGLQLAEAGYRLFCENYLFSSPLRSVGIRAIKLCRHSQSAQQLFLFEDNRKREKQQILEQKMDDICGRFGKGSIKRAIYLAEPDHAGTPFTARFSV